MNNYYRAVVNIFLILSATLLPSCSQKTDIDSNNKEDNGISVSQSSKKFLKIEAIRDGGSALGGSLPGRLAFQPQAVSALATPVQARILTVHVRPGQIVTRGMPLLTLRSLDAASARAELAQAQARTAAAEDLLRRQNEMVKRGVGLEVERFGAETAAREARAELARARSANSLIGNGRGDTFTLHAPGNGVVLKLGANVGAVAIPDGEPLVEIGDPKRLWVIADIPENAVGSLAIGSVADVHIPGAGRTYRAILDGMGQLVDGEQRRLPIYLRFGESPSNLAAGMLAQIRFETGGGNIISVPSSAVLIKDGTNRIVYVQRADGKFIPRPVTIGEARDGRVTILKGLQIGERIVAQGALLLDSSAEQQL